MDGAWLGACRRWLGRSIWFMVIGVGGARWGPGRAKAPTGHGDVGICTWRSVNESWHEAFCDGGHPWYTLH